MHSCDPNFIVHDNARGDDICTNCGLITKHNNLSAKDENLSMDSSKDRAGFHGDTSNPYLTLGSRMNNQQIYSKSFYRQPYAYKMNNIAYVHAVINNNHKAKSIQTVFNIFDQIKEKNNLSEVTIRKAKHLYNIMSKSEKINKGQKRKGVLAACLYNAALIHEPLFRNDVIKMFDLPLHVLLEGEKKLLAQLFEQDNELFKKVTRNCWEANPLETNAKYTELIISQLHRLNLDYKKYKPKCLKLFNACNKDLNRIEMPSQVAGVISFIVHTFFKDKQPSKKQITQLLNITSPTLSNALKLINASLKKQNLDNLDFLN